MSKGLLCYCCGEPLGARFALVTLENNAERAFLMASDHTKHAAHPAQVIYVTRDDHAEPVLPVGEEGERRKRDE